MSEAEVDESIAALFAQHRGKVLTRIATIVHALRSMAGRGLSEDERKEAYAFAHALRGSLGSSGYPVGSDLGKAAEAAFEADDRANATRLADEFVAFAARIS
jgi:hypothetical protein